MPMPRPIRVMIVDDHAGLRNVLRLILSRSDEFQLAGEANSGQDALNIIRLANPDIVLVDIHMRPANGIETTRYLLSQKPQLVVVGFSGMFSSNEEKEMLAAGAVAVLSKNMRPQDLLSALRSLCDANSSAH